MNAMPIATFVVEPQPVHGYRVTSSDGPDAGRLQRSALRLLDSLGQPSPNGPPSIHAWLGPIGPRGEFVRVVIERKEGGEFRFRQVWYSDKGLPAHPARCGLAAGVADFPEPAQWPSDVPRVIETARRAAESGDNEWVSIPASVEGLTYCLALTEVLGTPPANRLTWITHAPAAAVPVHLQFRSDPGLPMVPSHPSLPTGEQRLRHVTPIALGKSFVRNGHTRGHSRAAFVAVFVLLAFAGGLAAGWFGRDGFGGVASAFAASVPGALPGTNQVPQPTNPKSGQLADKILASREVREKLHGFLSQEKLAGAPGAEPSDKTTSVVLNSDLDFGKYERKKMTEKEVRQVLDLLKALEEWQDAQPASASASPR
jgi:hypothetical protein